jgi:hypothetical protein
MTGTIVDPPARRPGERHNYLTEIAEISVMVDVWARMLASHVPDVDGLCKHRQCGLPGYGTPHVVWPCSSWTAANAAANLHRRDARAVA